jgi:VWFA-related protein
MTGVRRPAALLALLLLASVVRAQEPRFAEELDVEVVGVDVVATGEDGAPVPGLAAGDFEVLDDGQPVQVTHFTAEGGPDAAASPLHLVLLFDDAELPPADRTVAFAAVRRQLDRFLGAADRVLVARQGAGIRIEQPFTADRALLEAALDRLEHNTPGVPADVTARRAVLSEIRFGQAAGENALGPEGVRGGEMQKDTEQSASTSLTAVRSYAEGRRTRSLQALSSLDRLASALAGLPGRKAILLVSAGYDLSPGDEVYQAWLAKYRATRAARGSGNVDLEQPGREIREGLRELAAGASASRVAFYATTPAGGAETRLQVRLIGSPSASGEPTTVESLRLLTEATGGLAVTSLEGIDLLTERLAADLRGHYSLAYPSPHPADGAWHSLAVRVRRPGVRTRSAAGYRAQTPDQRTLDRAAAALLLDVAENPLDLRVDLGAGTRERDGSYTVPVTVKVPLARLMLLPRGSEHEGHLSLFFLTRDGEGSLFPARKMEAPVRIANAKMVESMGQTGVYETSLRVRPGEYRLAVAVRDDVAALESALSLDLKVQDEGRKKGRGKDAG